MRCAWLALILASALLFRVGSAGAQGYNNGPYGGGGGGGGASSAAITLSSFGCIGNGVVDDAPCFRAARDKALSNLSAVPNSATTIYGAAGATYNLTSIKTSGDGCGTNNTYVCDANANNITWNGNGARITTSGNSAFLFSTTKAYNSPGTYGTGHPFTNALRGARSVTLITPASATDYTVGDVLWLCGEVTDFNDCEVNKLVANSGVSTGILTLANPLSKDMNTGTPAVVDTQSFTGFNHTIKNWTVVLGPHDYFTDQEGVTGIYEDNVHVSCTACNGIEFTNSTMNRHVTNSWFENDSPNCGGGVVFDDGSVDGFVENSTLRVSGCAAGEGVLGGGEGSARLHFSNNTIINNDFASGDTCIDFTATWDSTITGNMINSANGFAYVTNNGAGANYTAGAGNTAVGNTIQQGLIKFGGLEDQFVGNTITAGTVNGAGFQVQCGGGPVNFSHNNIYFINGNGLVINFPATVGCLSSLFDGNYFQRTGGSAVNWFNVPDPGSPQTWPLTITNNVFNPVSGGIVYAGSAAANLPQRVISNNTGTADYKGSFLFASIGTNLVNNGDTRYCSDCTIANPCAGSGSGAYAKRLNGINVCN
jgi:hypothetical protein